MRSIDVDAEGGNDTVVNSITLTIEEMGVDVIATLGAKTLGTDGSEVLVGLDDQGDQLVGGDGADVLRGFSVGGNDVSRLDMADYSVSVTGGAAITEGVDVNLATGRGRFGHAQGDSYVGVEGAIGTDFADRFAGNGGVRNTFNGGLGNDVFVADLASALTNADNYQGGAGNDVLSLENIGAGRFPLAVNLNKTVQDFDGDALRDASIVGIESVITSQREDFITLVSASRGNLNANTVYVNRRDNGNDIIINFDAKNDALDLSGVLRTGQQGDLNRMVKLSAGANASDTLISIDKDLDGVVDSTVTLQGVASNTWASAHAMAQVGRLVANGLIDKVATASAANTHAGIEGGRYQYHFDPGQGATFAAGAVFTFNVGGSSVSYTTAAEDTTWAGVAVRLAAAINASGRVDGTATTDGAGGVVFSLNAYQYAVVNQIDVSRTMNGVSVDLVVGGNGTSRNVYGVEEWVNAEHATYSIDYGAKVADANRLAEISLDYKGTLYTQVVAGGNLGAAITALAYAFNNANPFAATGVMAMKDGNKLSFVTGSPYVIDFNFSGSSPLVSGNAAERAVMAKIVIKGEAYYGGQYWATSSSVSIGGAMANLAADINAGGKFIAVWDDVAGDMVIASRDGSALSGSNVTPSLGSWFNQPFSYAHEGVGSDPDADKYIWAYDKYFWANMFVSAGSSGAGNVSMNHFGRTPPTLTSGEQKELLEEFRRITGKPALDVKFSNEAGGIDAKMQSVPSQSDGLPSDFDDQVSAYVKTVMHSKLINGTYLVDGQSNSYSTASAQVNTVTLAGTVSAGSEYSVTIDGRKYSVAATATDTNASLAGALAALINAERTNVQGEWRVALNPATAWAAGDTYTVALAAGTQVTYTVTTTDMADPARAMINIRAGVIAAINASGIAGVQAVVGGSENVIKVISKLSELALATQYDATGTPAAVNTTATDVARVQEFFDAAAAQAAPVAAVAAGGVLTLTGASDGDSYAVSAQVVNAAVQVLQGEQFLYAYANSADTFVWRDDALRGEDRIRNFQVGQDRLDLTDLFSGQNGARTNFLSLTDNGAGGSLVIAVDTNGAAAGGDVFSIILLGAGVGTGALTLDQLINQGSLLLPGHLA